MNKDLPVIFLAFANEQHEGRYLPKIVEEYKQLYGILRTVASNESAKSSEEMLCELVIRQNVTIGEIVDVFQNPLYQNRIAIFHYGGHADGYQLLLEGKEGQSQEAKGEGLVSLLGRRKSLKLVFLNGCSTQQLARDLVDRGVPAVIGASASISDDAALQLSKRFYQGLVRGFTMAGAWEEAKDELRMFGNSGKDKRGIALRSRESDRFPWDVEFRDDAGKEVFDRWNLPEEANNPLFRLPKLPAAQLPPSPFLFLKPYTPEYAEVFFGRSYYIRDLWLKIVEPNAPPLILLYGESGAGKSSLLDAGLRPRLEAAVKDDDPDAPRFVVRYGRRDQDRGLVGTLADLLGYRPEEAPEKVKKPAPARPDPDREKIEAIEALARELKKEETRNTLQIYLQRHRAERTEKKGRRRNAELYQKGQLGEAVAAELRRSWAGIEQETGRPLILILDQVEELFSRPNKEMKQELEDLLGVLKEIFRKPAEGETEKIRGKIILGYREEFNAKILARVKDYELARSTVFLEQLNEADIREVFQGLQRGKVGEYYGITVDDSLPTRIAGHLLRSRTAVAPVLQLLLTKLWKKTYDEKTDSAAFTTKAYDEIQSKREEMEEYFLSQMKKVRAWNPEVVESGLVLDILHYHVSDLGTSRRRHIREIDQRYQHLEEEYDYPEGFVDQLVVKLKDPEVFLLNDEGHGYTGLPHDTLAPIISREYHRSDKLGQRSARILDIKAPDLERARWERETLKKLRLDDNDLEIVEGGKKGMRDLSEAERRLLTISLEEREKRLRLRRILLRGGIVAGLFILFLTILSGMLSVSVTEQLNQAITNSAHEQSLAELNRPGEVDYFGALQLAQFAYKNSPVKRLDVVRNMHGILQDATAMQAVNDQFFFDEEPAYGPEPEPAASSFSAERLISQRPLALSLQPEVRINSLEYQPLLGLLAGLDGGRLTFRPGGRPELERTIDFSVYTQGIREAIESNPELENILWTNVDFTADGKYLQLLIGVNTADIYLLDEEPVGPPLIPLYIPSSGEYLGDYDLFTGTVIDGEANRYAPWEFYDIFGYPFEVSIGDAVVDVEELFYFQLWDEQQMLLRKADWQELLARGWPVANLPQIEDEVLYDPERSISLRATNLSRRTNNSCLVWDPASSTDDPVAVFYEEGITSYFSALSGDRVLVVRPGGEALIRNAAGETLRSFAMPAAAPHIGVSPDRRHIFAISRDSVLLWDLYGVRDTAYRQEDIRSYGFSPDGAYLFTQSATGVRVWSEDGRLQGFPLQLNDSVVVARFRGYNHLVIGSLTSDQRGAWWKRILGGKKKQQRKIRIDYWDLQSGIMEKSFEAPGGGLIDVAVSESEDFAVAVQPVRSGDAGLRVGPIGNRSSGAGAVKTRRPEVMSKATVIPSAEAKRRFSKGRYNADGIQPLPDGKEETEAISTVFLSPGGRYIVRQSGAKQIELFDLRGLPVNAFEIGDGFLPGGYNRELFTSDDYYLLTHKTDEVFFWHPEDDQIEWPVYDLDVYDKQYYGLISFTDYIPGRTTANKFWTLGVLALALIFSLLYFSDAIIRSVQQRRFLELGLYGAGFLLLTLLMAGMWGLGITEEGLIEVAFYSMVLATLGLVVTGIVRQVRLNKLPVAAVFAVTGLLLIFGAGNFLLRENKEVEQANRETYLRDLRKDYQLNLFNSKAYYDSLYLAVAGPAEGRTGALKLSGAQLGKVAEQYQVNLESDFQEGETRWLFFSLIFTGFFGAVIFFPLYLGIKRHRAGRAGALYRMLLWPLGFILLAGWAVIASADDEWLVLDILNAGAGLFLLAAGIRRGRAFYRDRNWGSLAIFGSLMLLSVLLLAGEGGLFAPALAAVFIEARRDYLRRAHRPAFLWTLGGFFLVFGALALSVYRGVVILAGLLVVAPLLLLVFYGLRRQQRNLAAQRETGKPVWLNRTAMAGLWLTGVFAAFMYLGFLITESYEDADYYEYEEVVYQEEAPPVEEIAVNFEPAMEEDSLPEEVDFAIDTPAFETETADFAEAAEPAVTPAAEPITETSTASPEPPLAPEPSAREPVDFSSSFLNNRQRLIVELFDPSAEVRDQARRNLAAYWSGDRALIAELVQFNNENPDMNEGIWNTIYLLEVQPDALLRRNRSLLLPYLDWVSKKGYGPETMERVNGLRDRVR